jgi:sigma-B regulation protein RsbU (phosphoserine phosphatase)
MPGEHRRQDPHSRTLGAIIAGHGISASLHMANIQAMLRSIVPWSHSPSEVAKQVHRLFVHNIHLTTFVTLFIGAFDPGSRSLACCNAGHNPYRPSESKPGV